MTSVDGNRFLVLFILIWVIIGKWQGILPCNDDRSYPSYMLRVESVFVLYFGETRWYIEEIWLMMYFERLLNYVLTFHSFCVKNVNTKSLH